MVGKQIRKEEKDRTKRVVSGTNRVMEFPLFCSTLTDIAMTVHLLSLSLSLFVAVSPVYLSLSLSGFAITSPSMYNE